MVRNRRFFVLSGTLIAAVCFAAPGKDRPKEFSAKAGAGEFIHVWKKAAK